jgi:hypothetical protein
MNTRASECNGGYIRIYAGTKPADADTALAGNTLLATLQFSATAFGAADSSANVTANAITSDTDCAATGTASFGRVYQSDGTTAVCDLTTAELNLSSLSVVQHGSIGINSMVLGFPAGT